MIQKQIMKPSKLSYCLQWTGPKSNQSLGLTPCSGFSLHMKHNQKDICNLFSTIMSVHENENQQNSNQSSYLSQGFKLFKSSFLLSSTHLFTRLHVGKYQESIPDSWQQEWKMFSKNINQNIQLFFQSANWTSSLPNSPSSNRELCQQTGDLNSMW